MVKDAFIRIPLLITKPKRYFKEVIGNGSFTTAHVVYFGLVLLLALTVLHIFDFQVFKKYGAGLEVTIYLASFVFGLAISWAFRIYLLSIFLNRFNIQCDRKIGMIVVLAKIPSLLIIITFFIPYHYYQYIQIAIKAWSLILILIGIVSIYRIKWLQGIRFLVVITGIEMLFAFTISGTHISI